MRKILIFGMHFNSGGKFWIMWEGSREAFDGHKANEILNTGEFLVIDWGSPDGSGEYNIRYIADFARGNLFLSGGLGCACAAWDAAMDSASLKRSLSDVDSFAQRLQCKVGPYTYRWDNVLHDLNKVKSDILSAGGYDAERTEADFKEMQVLLEGQLDGLCLDGRCNYPDRLVELFGKYANPWEESPFAALGKRMVRRAYLWADGFLMACEQLGI